MSRWIDVPIVGGSYADDTRDWSFQDTVNWLPMRAERPGGRSLAMLRDVPGLRLKSVIGTGPYRGYRDVEGKRFVVSGTTLYQVAIDFTATVIGTIPGTGPVSLTHNQVGLDGGNELVIGTTDSGYVYNTKTAVFSQITDPGFPGLQSADFIGGYIIGIEPQRRYWYHSELADAREYNTTDIYSAEAAPDRLTRVIVVGNEVVAIGERTTEVFVNQPRGNAAFERATGVTQDKGSVSPHSIVTLDNTLWMLGSDGIVYRREGYNWVRKSHHAMEQDIARCDLERAFAFTYEDRGHAIYYLTFPDGKTWGYDVSQGEWARRESYGFDRWRVSGLVRWDGAWYAGDFADGSLYLVDWEYPGLEGCDEIVRRRTLGVLHDDYNRMAVNAVQLRVSTGQPEATEQPLTGDLGDGETGEVVSFQYEAQGLVPGEELVFSISAGALPDGLTMGADGLVTGTRGAGGVYSWTVRAVDRCDNAATLDDESETTVSVPAVYAAIDNTQLLQYSPDGETWDSSVTVNTGIASTNSEVLIECYNGRFFHVVLNAGAGSQDGVTWYALTGIPSKNPTSLKYVDGRWLLFFSFDASVYESANGVDFTAIAGTSGREYRCASVIGDTIVCGASSNTVHRSTDGGATWTFAINVGLESGSNTIYRVLATPTRFCAFGNQTSQSIAISTTGAAGTWSNVANPNTTPVRHAAYGAGRCVIIHQDRTTSYSDDDGLTWTAGAAVPYFNNGTGTQNQDNGLIYVNGVFIFGTTTATSTRSIYTSPDGLTWTERMNVSSVNATNSLCPFRAVA